MKVSFGTRALYKPEKNKNKEELKQTVPDCQHFPLDAVMLDSRPMTGQGLFLDFYMLVGNRVIVW